MNLPKAIEILDLNISEAGRRMPADTLTALKLAKEALERIQSHRRDKWSILNIPLPSETNDKDSN